MFRRNDNPKSSSLTVLCSQRPIVLKGSTIFHTDAWINTSIGLLPEPCIVSRPFLVWYWCVTSTFLLRKNFLICPQVCLQHFTFEVAGLPFICEVKAQTLLFEERGCVTSPIEALCSTISITSLPRGVRFWFLFIYTLEGACLDNGKRDSRLDKNALADYAAFFWGEHIRWNIEQALAPLAIQYLRNERCIQSPVQVVQIAWNRQAGRSQRFDRNIHGLWLAASLGLEHICSVFFEDGKNNLKSDDGENALHQAADHGYLAIVRLLLQEGMLEDMLKERSRRWLQEQWKKPYVEPYVEPWKSLSNTKEEEVSRMKQQQYIGVAERCM